MQPHETSKGRAGSVERSIRMSSNTFSSGRTVTRTGVVPLASRRGAKVSVVHCIPPIALPSQTGVSLPCHPLGFSLPDPEEVHRPFVTDLGRRRAERTERNPDLHVPPVRIDRGGRLPVRIPRQGGRTRGRDRTVVVSVEAVHHHTAPHAIRARRHEAHLERVVVMARCGTPGVACVAAPMERGGRGQRRRRLGSNPPGASHAHGRHETKRRRRRSDGGLCRRTPWRRGRAMRN